VVKLQKHLLSAEMNMSFLAFQILDGHAPSSESIPSRAVAKKSTTRRPDSIVDRMQDQQQMYPGVAEKSQQPQGRVEVRSSIEICSLLLYMKLRFNLLYFFVRLQVLTAASMKFRVFWVVVPCIHALMMEVVCASESQSTSMRLHGTTTQNTLNFMLYFLVMWVNSVRCSISEFSTAMDSWQIDDI
jgi:hypothetical protein